MVTTPANGGGAGLKLPFPLTATQLYARALWDPQPTTTLKSQKQLAYAMGYPLDWRVERTVTKNSSGKAVIQDVIHAVGGKKDNIKRLWLHHEAAQAAAAALETADEDPNVDTTSSHLLPPVAKYAKGDVVQVQWEGKWWNATITKRKKQGDEFLYAVEYHDEDTTQQDVDEEDIRPTEDPAELALELGFPGDGSWHAIRKGARFILTFTPTGEQFKTKKAAQTFLKKQQEPPKKKKAKKEEPAAAKEEDEGDPPWRRTGHEWIGRKIEWISQHKVSGTRKVKVTQIGTIVGYIADTDVDKAGNPGFTDGEGNPANLFNVEFPDDPHHQYASLLINSQDLEEQEVSDSLLPETAAAKKKRLAALEKATAPAAAATSITSSETTTPSKETTPSTKRKASPAKKKASPNKPPTPGSRSSKRVRTAWQS